MQFVTSREFHRRTQDIRSLEAAIEGLRGQRNLALLQEVVDVLKVSPVFGKGDDERTSDDVSRETFWRSHVEPIFHLVSALDTDNLPFDLRVALFAALSNCTGDELDRWHIQSLPSAGESYSAAY